jgi:hypothetical protein
MNFVVVLYYGMIVDLYDMVACCCFASDWLASVASMRDYLNVWVVMLHDAYSS